MSTTLQQLSSIQAAQVEICPECHGTGDERTFICSVCGGSGFVWLGVHRGRRVACAEDGTPYMYIGKGDLA
jgi:DnaJ-class molecular chaperone